MRSIARQTYPRAEAICDYPSHTHLTKRMPPINADSTIPPMNAMRITQAPFEPSSVRMLMMS